MKIKEILLGVGEKMIKIDEICANVNGFSTLDYE